MPATNACNASRRFGQVEPMVTAITATSTVTNPKRKARNEKGSAYGMPRRAPIKPVDHKSRNTTGINLYQRGWSLSLAWAMKGIHKCQKSFIPDI